MVAGGADRPGPDTAVQTASITPDGSADDQILQNTIDALAGVGSVVRVDGLSSGGLPPAATIQQIRILLISFDAEYHEATPAFVEIITNAKPQPWQVSFTTWNRPESAQARNAFAVGDPESQRGGANFSGTGNINNRASVNFFGNVNSGKEDQALFAQTPSGPVRGLVDNSNHYQYGTLRVGLDNWRRNDLRFESDYQNFRTLNVGAGGFNLAERGFTRDQTIVRARGFWTKPLGKGGSQVLRVQYQHRFESDTPGQHGARHRRTQRVLFGRRAVSGHARRPSDRSVGRGDAFGRHEADRARWSALLARRLRQLDCQQCGRHVHVLVARCVRRRTADDLHPPTRRTALLL